MRFKYAFFIFALAVVGCSGKSGDVLFAEGEKATHDIHTYDVAEAKLSEFLDRFPNDSRADIALQALARVLMNQNKHAAAIARYESLIQHFPDSRFCAQAQFMIAYIYDQDGEYEKAKVAYQKVIENYAQSELADDAQISIQNMGKTPETWLFPETVSRDSSL
ncbi:MAG: TolA-binding protein [Candidatus Latescibacterota bacterium]|jgi:TolA-binding protein